MNAIQRISIAFGLAAVFLLPGGNALAQSTDGYHSIQIFPMVVDTASFAQRYNFRNPNLVPIVIKTKYFPANTTSQANIGPLSCNDINIPAGKSLAIVGLRTLCPGLVSQVGSQFGFLHMSEQTNASLTFAAFSRVTNPQGNGFTVEAFPAHTFTSADGVINGLRRLAATANSPTFQTNCFIGNLNELANPLPPGSPSTTKVHYTLYSNASAVLGQGDEFLKPGQFLRMSEIFSYAGAPAGDFDDAYIKIEELNTDTALGEPGIISFCTVQESTTFGADFRIGKQELGAGGLSYPGDIIGSQDNHVARETLVSTDGVGRNFEIGTGASSNTHVVYFRHPDFVQCELIDPATSPPNITRLLNTYGLEMRMLDQDGLVVAGGPGVTGWSDFYLGDKTTRNNGANTRYTIEVESNGSNTGSTRPYKLHCQSGSGHTLGDIIRYKEAVNRF